MSFFARKTADNGAVQINVDPTLMALVAAVDRSFAVIEFKLDGTIITANRNFLNIVGYSLEEIVGKPHSIFVEPKYRDSAEYRQFWEKLRRGEFDRGQYRRLGKNGAEAWLEASYNPVLDGQGRPFKVVKFATDITELKKTDLINTELRNSLDAMNVRIMAADTAQLQAERDLEQVVSAVLKGDMRSRIGIEGKEGFFATLSQRINELLERFEGVLLNVKVSAAEVARGVEEISQGNEDLSRRTEAQASSLEETASSMEEMTASVRQNADNSGQANQLAVAARDQADKGGAVVAKAVKAMSEINSSSKKIADIIGVIDEIAFQTNLLALNAAVEAARAGEQGRGFAVVASEVRNLAGRSATAAKEIKALIRDSVQKVDEGSTLVAQSGQTLEQIVGAVKKVSDIIAEIAASSQEQSSGIEQVNKAVMQLDEMTQQNAALVEQATAASKSLSDQSRALSDEVSQFQFASEGQGGTVANRRPVTKTAPPPKTAPRPQRKPQAVAPAPLQGKKAVGDDSSWQEF